jgi:hypothetical protein
MTRWCKLVALVVGWSTAAGTVALAQDAPAPQPTSRFSLTGWFRGKDSVAPPPVVTSPMAEPDEAPVAFPPFPGLAGGPPVAQPGAPPPPPFGKGTMPPAVAPPGPDRPPNGFSDPIPPDAENGFEPCPEPKCVESRPYYFTFEYLHWWVQHQPMPALVTTGSITDNVPGAFGQPHTQFVVDSVTEGGAHDGIRLMFGYDFDPQGCLGAEVGGFWLCRTAPSAIVGGNGNSSSPVLTRPFYNVNTGLPDADPINIPGVMAGTMIATAPLRITGAEANVRWLVDPAPTYGPRFTALFGFNFVDLDEKLLINEDLTDTPGLGAAGNRYLLHENFTTYNRFYGGQIGGQTEWCVGPVSLIFTGKCALGRTEETLEISGSTRVIEANGTVATNPTAALYTGPGNVGRYTGGEFAVMPQGQFKLAYQFNRYFRMDFGYDAFWISRVIRPGEQINQYVNVQPVGGPPIAPLAPSVLPFQSSGLWTQGFSLGLEVNF